MTQPALRHREKDTSAVPSGGRGRYTFPLTPSFEDGLVRVTSETLGEFDRLFVERPRAGHISHPTFAFTYFGEPGQISLGEIAGSPTPSTDADLLILDIADDLFTAVRSGAGTETPFKWLGFRSDWIIPSPLTGGESEAKEAYLGKLADMLALQGDWDGHGASSISPEAGKLAERFMKQLPATISDCDIYPEPDGSVGWECHKDNDFSLYLSFSPEEEIAYVAVYRHDGPEEVHRGKGIKMVDRLPEVLQRFIYELADPVAGVSIFRDWRNPPK